MQRVAFVIVHKFALNVDQKVGIQKDDIGPPIVAAHTGPPLLTPQCSQLYFKSYLLKLFEELRF